MKKPRRKLSSEEKRARRERSQTWMTIFVDGKQKRVPRPPTIDGLPVDEFVHRNADPIWLLQEQSFELLHERDVEDGVDPEPADDPLFRER